MIYTDEKYILISSPVNHENFGSRIVLLVVLFGVSLTFFFLGFSHEPYMAFGYVILGLICLIVTLIVLRRLLNLKTLKITKIAIFLESIRGKSIVINREDIVSFHEKHLEETSNKRVHKWDELLLFTKNDYISVSSKIHPDYKKVKLILTEGLEDFLNDSLYRKKKKIRENPGYSLKLFLLGFLCISFPVLKFFYIEYAASDMEYNQLTEIKGKIRPYSDVITESKPKKEIGLKFELNEYPNMEFKLYKEYFKDTDYKDFSNALYTDNEVILSISLDEYRKKISEELPIKFLDKYFNFNTIQVFGAKFGNIEIKRIKIRPANNSEKNEFSYLDGVSSYLLIGISALFMYLGTQHWREYKEALIEEEYN